MEVDCIPFRETGYFSTLICDYLDEHENLKPFYNRFPHLQNFQPQINEKKANYATSHRKVLVETLNRQYKGFQVSKLTQENIAALESEDSFTITTGHQLNIFTGPLYFLYKIVSTINLSRKLKKEYPKYQFVPVYWMATEDHDFDEINHFNFEGKKIAWDRAASGVVGELDTQDMDKVLKAFSADLGEGQRADELVTLFRRAYLEHNNLADATRFLVNELFGDIGLVIVDGNDTALKKLLIPYIKQDVFEQIPYKKVSEAIVGLTGVSSEYNIQVNPREINYFYLREGLRERIVRKDEGFHVVNTKLSFTKAQLEKEMDGYPERFSPNVIARPLFQEVILPNLCYIGGGGELAYWLELKPYFEAMDVTFPMLLLRNSVLLLTEKQKGKVERLDLKVSDLFLKQHLLAEKKVRDISDVDIDFSPQKQLLENQFQNLYQLAEKTDKSFLGAVKAQEVKQKKGLDVLEKRLLKAQKRKLQDHVKRTRDMQDVLFPNQSLQERQLNFSKFYLEMGDNLIPTLLEKLDPLKQDFLILRY
ncbi:bacillithiol biosynthesis cysteine-adding enzyme BshC [Muricauda sp. JGD-17]|uniref:Putative cysteine ligase BshC n=1 Tax=Flagellimonas ochracea TaxID=2696472 RepID=A0A964TF49_9FLAO|nr:bacillithiol biosynthesis cysteine-adding enzyme BshC [Allomuricauda ochracea]NAY93156.1 bacillithiol biosynthesis cysteine-adding enzyme BshC [Allomuricauda ochracea]